MMYFVLNLLSIVAFGIKTNARKYFDVLQYCECMPCTDAGIYDVRYDARYTRMDIYESSNPT